MPAGDLCTLSDVRAALELPTADTSRDSLISTLITVASQQLMQQAEREFAPSSSSGTTRRIRADWRALRSRIISLAPYDLQTATAVILAPESTSPVTLVAGTDYELAPVVQPSDEPVYTSIRLSNFLAVVPGHLIRFDSAFLDITGTWGFPTVPVVVKQACVDCVTSWLRRDVQAFGLSYDDGRPIDPNAMLTLDLPVAALRRINPYRRHAGAF